MNLDQERRAYELYLRASNLAENARDALLAELSAEPEIADEIRNLLALHHDEASIRLNGLTQALGSSGVSLPGGEDLVGTTLGPYFIESQIRDSSGKRKGAMGLVYKARRNDETFNRSVAIKVVPWPDGRERERELFLQERKNLGELEHPNIVRVLDAGSLPDGRPYFVMEWVEGGSDFTNHCVEGGLSVRKRVELFLSVCSAVAFAHRNQLIHRDLKPSNIQVDKDGVPKLLDFGLSSPLGEQSGRDLARSILTPAYASPEQRRHERLQLTSDIYSLGVILHEAITGFRPGESGANQKGSKGASIDPELSAVLNRMLADDPEKRFKTVDAVETDLKAWLSGRTVEAFRVVTRFPSLYVSKKFVQRHMVSVAVAAVAVVLLIGASLTVLLQRNEAIRQSVLARQQQSRAERGEDKAQQQTRIAESERRSAQRNEAVAQEQTRRAEAAFAESERQRNIAVARQLSASAQLQIDAGDVATGALLALESNRRVESFEANQSARRALRLLPERVWHYQMPQTANRLTYSRNGKYIAAFLDGQGVVEIREAASGAFILSAAHGLVAGCERPSVCASTEVAFHPVRAECATSGPDGLIRVWDLRAKRLLRELAVDKSGPHQVEYWGTGNVLAASLSAIRGGLFDVATGKLLDSSLTDGELPSLSADGRFYFIEQRRHQKRSISLRDPNSHNEIGRIVPSTAGEFILRICQNPAIPQAAAFVGRDMKSARLALIDLRSPQGETVATASFAPTFDLNGIGTLLYRLAGDERLKLRFSADGKHLTAFDDKQGVLVDAVHRKLLKSYAMGTLIEAFVEGSTLLTPPGPREIRTYRLPDLQLASVLQQTPAAVAVSPSGNHIAVAGNDGELDVWSASDSLKAVGEGRAVQFAFSPDSQYLSSLHRNGAFLIQSTGSERIVFRDQLEPVAPGFVNPGIRFSPSGKLLAVHLNGRVTLYQRDPWSRVSRSETLGRAAPGLLNLPAVPEFLEGERWLQQKLSERLSILSLPDLKLAHDAGRAYFVGGGTAELQLVHSAGAVEVVSLPQWKTLRRYEIGEGIRHCAVNKDFLACTIGPLKRPRVLHVWHLGAGKAGSVVLDSESGVVKVELIRSRVVLIARNSRTKHMERLEYQATPPRLLSRREAPEVEAQFSLRWRHEVTPTHDGEGWALTLFVVGPLDEWKETIVQPVDQETDGPTLARLSTDQRFAAFNSLGGVFEVHALTASDLARRVCRKLQGNLSKADWSRYLPGDAYRPTCPEPSPQQTH